MMLLAEDIERLIEKTNILKSLSGMCLSVNNNPGLLEFEKITAVMVVKEDSNKKITPIAFGATQKVSSTQYYCMINIVDNNYIDKYISVTENIEFSKLFNFGNFSVLSINNVELIKPSFDENIIYYSVFQEHHKKLLLETIFDEMIKKLNINNNFYVTKNMTIDIMVDESISKKCESVYRNNNGFNIIDNISIQKCTYNFESLRICIGNYEKPKGICVELIDNNYDMLMEYDTSIMGIKRKEYLKHLLQLGNIQGILHVNENNIISGYALSINNHILGCYGDTENIQMHLLSTLLLSLDPTNEITFFFSFENNTFSNNIALKALELREVRRIHTLSLIPKLNRKKIAILNVGCHLF